MRTHPFVRSLVVGAVLLTGATAWAADVPPPPATRPGPTARIEAFKQAVADLGLGDEQRKAVDDMFAHAEGQMKQMLAQFEKDQTPPRQRMDAFRKWGEEVRAKLEAALNDEQRTKLREKMTAMRPGPAGMGAFLIDRVKAALENAGLGEDQKTKVSDLLAAARQRMEELRAAATSPAERRAVLEKLRGVLDDLRAGLKNVLTPEQQEKVKGLLEGLRLREPGSRSAAGN